MAGRLPPETEREIDDLVRELRIDRPLLAHRLATVAAEIKADSQRDPGDYVSTGEAAAALQVSPNTLKKWIRLGLIRDFWTLPGSGYLRVARSEVERIRAEGRPAINETSSD